MKSGWRPAILLVFLAAIGSGCGSGGQAGQGGKGSASQPSTAQPGGDESSAAGGLRQRNVSELPAVGDYLPPLDGGKVEVAGPAGWTLLPRDSKYLVRFVKGQPSSLPRLMLYVEDSPNAELTDVTADNAQAWAAWLDKDLAPQSQLGVPELNLPIVLGPTVFLRHVRLASLSGTPVVIQSLQTVQNGRLYKVELVCAVDSPNRRDYEASLKKYRDDGYAVAANMKFSTAAAAESPLPAPSGETNPAAAPENRAAENAAAESPDASPAP
ncbi:MAG: hypothetical protein MUF06_14730 [Pirellulaceae bacterium]|nr:hypothetical protein [Pirellulaceae bacterium]